MSKNDEIDEIFNNVSKILFPFPRIKSYVTKYYNKLKIKNLLIKNRENFKREGVKILYLEDLERFKYFVSQEDFLRESRVLSIDGRKMLDYLMEETKKYNNNYRKIDIHMIYENYYYYLGSTINIYQYIQIFLKYHKIENIFIPEHLYSIYFFFKVHSKGEVKLHRYKNSRFQSLLKWTLLNFSKKIAALPSTIFKQNENQDVIKSQIVDTNFNQKFIFNIKNPNIGFLYYSITHKRVGNEIFEYLKNQKYNVIEIDPYPNKMFRIKRMFKKYWIKKRILRELRKLYFDYITNVRNPLFSGFLFELYEIISRNIKEDFISIDYLYRILLENNPKVLIIFNDNSGYGKTAAFVCKILGIKTLYIPHGGITDTIIDIYPRRCDLMILNTKIEKEFLLNGKLDPAEYEGRLIPLGNPYFQFKKLEKVIQIQDSYNKKKIISLEDYKYIILVALGAQESYSNPKIIEDLVSVLKSQQDFKDILLIIKLHPTDHLNLYKNSFRLIKDISYVVTHKMDIRNLIFSSDLFLTTPSTTILEGLLLKKPTIILDYYYYLMRYLYQNPEIVTTVHDQQELNEVIKTHLFDENFRKKYIESIYNFGTEFCAGSENDDFRETFNAKLLKTLQQLLDK